MRDSASNDELNHDIKQARAQEAFEATQESREIAIEETYEELANDSITLWEALGPDGFQSPYSGNGMQTAYKNRIAESAFRQSISDAVLARDDAELGRLLGDQARAYLRKLAENKHE